MVQKWHDIWLVHKTCSHVTLKQERAYARGIQLFGKKARENPERFCGWFPVDCSSKKFARMALDAMDVCLRMLKESDKSRLDRCSVRNSVLIISHIIFRDCRVHIYSDSLSRNSCILLKCPGKPLLWVARVVKTSKKAQTFRNYKWTTSFANCIKTT